MKRSGFPPKLFHRFFRWYCHPKMLDYIEGDLLELYRERLEESGKRLADIKFIIDVLLLFRPGIIRSRKGYENLNQYAMLRSYLRVGWRSLLNNKVFSLINISGLSLGLTCSILIALWVHDEYRMDAFHDNIDRIYAVTSCEYSGDERNGSFDTPGFLGEELPKVVPEVEYACNVSWTSYFNLAVSDKTMKLPGKYTGPDFFKIFSYPLLIGTKETALQTRESIAISRKMATNFFGNPERAIDQTLRFENYRDLKVTAVFEDLPDNASEKFEYLLSWDFFVERNDWLKVWHNSGPQTYVLLREHTRVETVQPKIQHFIKNYDNEYTELDHLELGLEPFREKYLHSNFKNGKLSGGRIEYVRLFELVAIFILLIACINFMNLSTARSLNRSREIGVRKVIGALRTSLIARFMSEAFLYTIIAVVLSIVMISIVLPQFNLLTGKNIRSPFTDSGFWLGLIALTLVAGFVSGSYPSLLLSSFKPITVLKSNIKIGATSGFFRKTLVVFQFAMCMIFIVGMIVITQQVQYIQTKNLGYQKNNLIYLALTGNVAERYDVFKNEALKIAGITSVTSMSHRPLEIENTTSDVEWEGKQANTLPTFVQASVGYDFVKTMEATIVYGRDFSEDHADSTNYIINEAALRVIGYEDPVGKPLKFWGAPGTIIGVVKDFHFNSLHVPISPLVLRLKKGTSWGYALIRVQHDKTAEALASLEALHQKMNPAFVFAHQFADEEYAMLYQSEHVVKKLSGYFAFLAIFISCLGLLGLVIFTAEQRTKEIGIRKVLGATVYQIVTLLSRDFVKLIVIAILLALPAAYFAVDDWLAGFEYHIGIHWSTFVIAGTVAVAIALATISVQAIHAGLANPAKSLRSE